MKQLGYAGVLAVILGGSFFCFTRGWDGLGAAGILCAALYFFGMD